MLTAYLGHLLLPLLLLLDALWALHVSTPTRITPAIAGACSVWLAAGAVPLLLPNRRKFLLAARKPLLAFYCCLLCLGAFEFVARRIPSAPALFKPGWSETFYPDTSALAGLSPVARFTVNDVGLRGSPFPHGVAAYRFIAVGGSSTLCPEQDDANTWPHLLMEELNRRQNRAPVWVANAGVNGHTAVEHLTLIRTLPVVATADALIFLMGFNDLVSSLAFRGAATQDGLRQSADLFREQMLQGGQRKDFANRYPVYRRLRSYELTRAGLFAGLRALGFRSVKSDLLRSDYAALRRRRIEARRVPRPDLTTAIEEYRARVDAIAQMCRQRGQRCILLTQPTLWRADLDAQEEALLWFGWVGPAERPDGYISAADAARAMEMYNRALLEAAHNWKIEAVDLAAQIPKRTSLFCDDVHLSDEGSRIVAHAIADGLVSQMPLAPPNQ